MRSTFSTPASQMPPGISPRVPAKPEATGAYVYFLAAAVLVLLLVSADVLELGEALVGSVAVGLVAIAWGKARFGTRATRPAPPERKDWGTTRAAFAQMGDGLIAQSLEKGQPVTVVVLEQGDLAELSATFGPGVARKLVARLAAKLQTVACAPGAVARTDVAVFTLLLPGFTHAMASAALQAALGSTVSIEVDAGDEELVLMPDFLIRTLQGASAPLAEVYDSMRRTIERARKLEERRQKYLRAERESHCTKPAPLMADDRSYAAYPRHEPTIQMPLGLR